MFSPNQYLEQQTKKRKGQFKRTFVVTLGIAFCTLGSVSLTTHASPFMRSPQVTTAPSYRVLDRPVKAPNTTETVQEEFVDDDFYYNEDYDYIGENGCNVLAITITGDIGTDYGDTTSNNIRDILDEYADDKRVQAILVDVDSGGGSPVAGDEIATLLAEQTIPVIAQIREMGGSAAYMAILPADYIFAHRFGSVGSLGVIIPFIEYSKLNEKEGITYAPILTSPGKDMGTSERPLSAEERAILQAEVDFIYQAFLKDVATYRNLSQAQVNAVSNGRTFLSHIAKEAGLIDAVGGRAEVMEYLENTISATPVVCRPTLEF